MDRKAPTLSADRGRAGYVPGFPLGIGRQHTSDDAIRDAAHAAIGGIVGPAAIAFDHWQRGERRLAALEAWLDTHGSSLNESDWNHRLSKMETVRESIARNRSAWISVAIDAAELFQRMKRHLDHQEIERLRSVDCQDGGTSESAVRRQWRHYLRDDYEPPPF